MATRIAKSTVDMARLQKLLPQSQQSIYSNLLSKSYQYTLRVASLPENLPKIDFEHYKRQLANPALIEKLEKGYLAYKVPVPKDGEDLLGKLAQLEKEEDAQLVQYMNEVEAKINALLVEKEKLTNLPPLEEMTVELQAYYFPEKCTHIDFWKHHGEKDKYVDKLKGT